MRYRRTRATTLENAGNPAANGAVSAQSSYVMNNWNTDGNQSASNSWLHPQNNSAGKTAPSVPQIVNQSRNVSLFSSPTRNIADEQIFQSGVASPAAANGAGTTSWPTFGDRPKSANVIAQSASGITSSVPSNNRPTSSAPAVSATAAAAGQWNATPSTTNLAANAATNSLSYGSLKNRFLSGTSKTSTSGTTGAGGMNAGVAATSTTNTAATNANSSKSKLFSLAR